EVDWRARGVSPLILAGAPSIRGLTPPARRVCQSGRRSFMRWVGSAAAAFLLLVGPVRAEVKDPADLFPSQTLAYLEFREPGRLAKEIGALVKGSVLENLPASIAKFRAEHPSNQFWMFQSVGMSGIFASPECIAELGRLQGAAVALTGF